MKFQESNIALVITWFGPLPFWMPAFVLSCRYNPSITWMIFSDSPPPEGLPDNVKFMPMSMDEFNRRASTKLGFKICLTPAFAYKLCDLKIMYGCIFENELHDFDFWGCCDMDVVWGDIRLFVTPEILANYDVITSRIGRISGHFCLFRNEQKWSQLFRRIPDVVALAKDGERCRRIDENGLTDLLQGYKNSSLRRFWTRRFKSLPLPRVYWDQVLTTSGKHQRQMLADPTLYMRWRDGKTYGVSGEQMMYLHFHSIRKDMHEIDFSQTDSPREFVITKMGIFAAPEAVPSNGNSCTEQVQEDMKLIEVQERSKGFN